jgi:phosphoribosyl 1,2-cyclic phosphodiesterase
VGLGVQMLSIIKTASYNLYDVNFKNIAETSTYDEAVQLLKRYEKDRLFVKIFDTGSGGNFSVIKFNDNVIIIDLPNQYSREKLINKLATINLTVDDIDLVLITHEHGDHYSEKLIRYLHSVNERIVFIFKNEILNFESDKNKKISTFGLLSRYTDLKISLFENEHDDTTSFGYVFNIHGYKYVWATDISNMLKIPKDDYKKLFIEVSYDKKGLRDAMDAGIYSVTLVKRIMRSHNSKDAVEDFCMYNGISIKDVIPLHMSKNSLDTLEPFKEVRYYEQKLPCKS